MGLNTLLFASRESEAESVDPQLDYSSRSSSVKSQSANMHVTDISTSDWDQIVIEEHTTNKHMWHLTADQQVEITNSWNRSSLNITEQQERRGAAQATAALNADNSHDGTSGEVSTEYFTSPPLSSFSVLLKDDGEFRDSQDFGSSSNDCIPQFRSENDTGSTGLDTSMTNLAMQDAMELVTFKLGQRTASTLAMRQEPAALESKSAAPKLRSQDCPSFWSSDDDDVISVSGIPMMNSSTGRGEHLVSTSVENDRGFRKKSREKMRRHEVNTKFEMLVNVLGLAGRARKKSILHEAASAIKGLTRECNQLRRERDHLQQELNNLASYLQSTGSGPPYMTS
ncbi:hypothetical protein PC128_g23307 [Phytophthora cactorum]|nr:hypothetical protein PC122_g13575 [Phytophthora cactorum]KAG3149931.1 hypothetical protein PC128_g23307 [Phytophthora cactorum]